MSTLFEQVVAELLEQINMGRTHEDLLNSIFARLPGIVPYDRIAVAVLDETASRLRLISCRSDAEVALKVGYEDLLAGSTLASLLHTGQPHIINDLVAYLDRKPESRSTRLIVREGMRSNLTLPLLAEGKPIGVVFFSSRTAKVYREEHVALLRRLAGHLAVAVEKTQLLSVLQERNRDLLAARKLAEQRYRLLASLGQLINIGLDLRQVVQRAAHAVRELVPCDRVSLILIDNTRKQRHGFAVEFGRRERTLEIPLQELHGSAAEWVLRGRQPRVVSNLAAEQAFVEDRKLFAEGYTNYVYLPLLCRDTLAGIWGLARKKEASEWDLPFLEELGNVLATALDNAAAYEQVAQLTAKLEQENVYLRDEIKTEHDFRVTDGGSAPMQGLRRDIELVAKTDSTVLILGETGTGKERVARAIHELSRRHEQLLVKVNCAALSSGLIGSELFGHEAGAFTGAAKSRPGRFEVAHQGTIFLDEIAEITAETQIMLLRVLQERMIERVGSNEPIPIDVRVIAATNRDLQEGVREGWFRADLFYRLNVFPIKVPPLRERREDIVELAQHFVRQFARKMNRAIHRISSATLEQLQAYAWPGNVRELENLIERAVIVCAGVTLEIDPTWLATPIPHEIRTSVPLAEVTRQTILDALERCAGKIYGPGGAAQALGLKPTTLYGKMRKYRITRKNSAAQYE